MTFMTQKSYSSRIVIFISIDPFEKSIIEYSHEIAPLVANSAPPILTDEHHLIA